MQVKWLFKIGDSVTKGQVMCEVQRGQMQNPAEVPAPASGKILQIITVRTDPRSGQMYTRVGSTYVKMLTDPLWRERYSYAPEAPRPGEGSKPVAQADGGAPAPSKKSAFRNAGKKMAMFKRMTKLAQKNIAVNAMAEVSAEHFERLVELAGKEDSGGFWQTTKKFTAAGTSRPGPAPGAASYAVQTMSVAYSQRAREAAAVLLKGMQ